MNRQIDQQGKMIDNIFPISKKFRPKLKLLRIDDMEYIMSPKPNKNTKSKANAKQPKFTNLQHRRIQGGRLIEQGYRNREIVKIFQCSLSSVKRWRTIVTEHGVEGLEPHSIPGRRPKLNEQQLEKLKRLLKQGATKFGYANAIWTSRRVKALILEKFGVSYSKAQTCRILRKIGYSPQKPIKRSKKHSAQAVEQWRRHKWPLNTPMSIKIPINNTSSRATQGESLKAKRKKASLRGKKVA